MQVLVNRGGLFPRATTLPSTRFPSTPTHRATRKAKPISKARGRVATGRNVQKESQQMAATYLPMRARRARRNVVRSKSTKGKSFSVPVHHAKRRTTRHSKGQFVRDARKANGQFRKGARRSNGKRRRNLLSLAVTRAGGAFASSRHGRVGKATGRKGGFKSDSGHTGAALLKWRSSRRPKRAKAKAPKHASKKLGKGGRIGSRRKNRRVGKRRANRGTRRYRANKHRGGFRRNNTGRVKYRTRSVLIHRTKHMRNPVGFDASDSLKRLGTWGKVGVSVLLGLAGLVVAFGIPKALAVVTKKDMFQRGWGGVVTASVATVGVSLLVSLVSKKASLGLLTAGGVGVVLLALNALHAKAAQAAIPLNEAVLAAMLPTFEGKALSADQAGRNQLAQSMIAAGMTPQQAQFAAANAQGVPNGMGGITYYPAAPGMGVYPQMPLSQVSHYPAGMGGYNAPSPGAVGTPNESAYSRAAGQVHGPQGYNVPIPDAVPTSDVATVRYSSTPKEKF